MSAHPPAAEDIRARRHRVCISQQALAGAARCSIASVRRFEGFYTTAEPSAVRARIVAALDELERQTVRQTDRPAGARQPDRPRLRASTGCDRSRPDADGPTERVA